MKTSLVSAGFLSRIEIEKKWLHLVILSLPWLVVMAAFDWMAKPFPTFHGSDEYLFHFPVIQRFFAELPWVNVRDYSSATSPLFHLLFALAAKVVGLNLQALRLVNIVVSLLAIQVLYVLLTRFTKRNEALILTLLFGLSPYFFGASFLVLTDNLGILFALLALRSFYDAGEHPDTKHWISLCFWIGLATLTRQLYVWLAVGAALAVFARREPLQQGMFKVVGLLLACLPLAALVVIWGGLTPPMFQQQHLTPSVITLRAGVFGLSVFGLHWLVLFPDHFVDCLRRLQDQHYLPIVGIIIITVAILFMVPTMPQDGDDGIIWRISRMMPELAGNSIVFWLLLPLGLLFFWNAARSHDRFLIDTMLMALAFLVSNLPNVKIYEKYYDPLVIAFIILIEARAQSSATLSRVSRPLLMVAFAIYPVISWLFVKSA